MTELSYGEDAPKIVNLVIEIRKGERNKYEFDKETGRLFLDRVNGTTLGYPSDYGYVPNTLCDDGDPLDGLLIIDESVPHGTVVPVRPIGVLYMIDDGEGDEKLICVPADTKVIEHFYSHYKDWKKDWSGVDIKFNGWGDASAAQKVITESIERAQK